MHLLTCLTFSSKSASLWSEIICASRICSAVACSKRSETSNYCNKRKHETGILVKTEMTSFYLAIYKMPRPSLCPSSTIIINCQNSTTTSQHTVTLKPLFFAILPWRHIVKSSQLYLYSAKS